MTPSFHKHANDLDVLLEYELDRVCRNHHKTVDDLTEQFLVRSGDSRNVLPLDEHRAQVAQEVMEALAAAKVLLLANDEAAERFEPGGRVRFEQLRIVRDYFYDEDAHIRMAVLLGKLVEEVRHEARHRRLLLRWAGRSSLLPLLTEEYFHALHAPLDVLHAPVSVHIVELKLAFLVGDESGTAAIGR